MEPINTQAVNRILDALDQSRGSMLRIDILNAFLPTPGRHTDDLLKFMIDEGLISGKLESNERINITPQGTAQLIAYREQSSKLESAEQSPTKINQTGKTVDSNQDKKSRLPKTGKLIFKVIAAIGTIAAAIVAIYEAYGIFF